MLVIAALMALNGMIRLFGGGPALLSPRWVPDKLDALGRMFMHLPHHVSGDCQRDLRPILRQAAKKHGLPAEFVEAVAQAESRSGAHQISHAGAMGVLQLTPDTADHLNVADPFDPEQNIDAGVRYLKSLWKRYGGDRVRVAAAYNWGPGRVPRVGPLRLPGETRHYVKRIMGS